MHCNTLEAVYFLTIHSHTVLRFPCLLFSVHLLHKSGSARVKILDVDINVGNQTEWAAQLYESRGVVRALTKRREPEIPQKYSIQYP